MLFSLPVGTEMFHFPTFPPHTLYIQMRVTRHHSCWVSPFGHPRITARLTAPRGLSQPPTSFIGSWCQGIHRTLLHTYKHYQNKIKMLASTVQFSNNTHPPTGTPQKNLHPSAITGTRISRHHRLTLEKTHSRVFPQDPIVYQCPTQSPEQTPQCSNEHHSIVSVSPMSSHHRTFACEAGPPRSHPLPKQQEGLVQSNPSTAVYVAP